MTNETQLKDMEGRVIQKIGLSLQRECMKIISNKGIINKVKQQGMLSVKVCSIKPLEKIFNLAQQYAGWMNLIGYVRNTCGIMVL